MLAMLPVTVEVLFPVRKPTAETAKSGTPLLSPSTTWAAVMTLVALTATPEAKAKLLPTPPKNPVAL